MPDILIRSSGCIDLIKRLYFRRSKARNANLRSKMNKQFRDVLTRKKYVLLRIRQINCNFEIKFLNTMAETALLYPENWGA